MASLLQTILYEITAIKISHYFLFLKILFGSLSINANKCAKLEILKFASSRCIFAIKLKLIFKMSDFCLNWPFGKTTNELINIRII